MTVRLLVLLFCLLSVNPVLADPEEDLQNGRAALQKGELDRALKWFNSAAEVFPDSVDVQLGLADCHLQMGQLSKALLRYRIVLDLSPKHVRARRIVTALAAQKATFAEQMAGVQTLMKLGAYAPAQDLLFNLLDEPLAPEQRTAVRLLAAEARLWSGETTEALQYAVRVAQDSRESKQTAPAKILAALALLEQPEIREAQLGELLAELGEVSPIWKKRAALVESVIQSRNPAKADSVSSKLIDVLAHIPRGRYLTQMRTHLAETLLRHARDTAERGEPTQVVHIVWPLLSEGKSPNASAVLKPIELRGGWLDKDASGEQVLTVGNALMRSAEQAFARSGEEHRVLHYWLASEVLRTARNPLFPKADQALDALVKRCSALGDTEFQRQAATLTGQANSGVNAFDAIALTVDGQLHANGRLDQSAISNAILGRYVQASRWKACDRAIELFYATHAPREKQLALLRLRIRRATMAEDALLEAQTNLPNDLLPETSDTLVHLDKLLQETPTVVRSEPLGLAKGLLDRYAKLGRFDLATKTLGGVEKTVPEWTLWQHIDLLDRQANADLQTGRFPKPLTLLASHRAELDHIATLLQEHPQSHYVADTVARVEQIATVYEAHHAFDTAAQVLAEFVEHHPKLASTSRTEYQHVRVLLAKAEFELKANADPKQLSPAATKATEAVLAFRKEHPVGEFRVRLQADFFSLAFLHAAHNQWAHAQTLLQRYEKSVPPASRPRLDLMKSATLLGRLDPAHGLALLRETARLPESPTELSTPQQPANAKVVPEAYQLLMGVLGTSTDTTSSNRARGELLWLIGFFERAGQPDAANVILRRWLTDRPKDHERTALRLRVLTNQFAEAANPHRPEDPANWLARRHALFEAARGSATKFVADHPSATEEANRARLLRVKSYEQEANLYAETQPVRAGGLLVASARALWKLGRTMRDHPEVNGFPAKANEFANRLLALQQDEQAIEVLRLVPLFDPTLPDADAAYLRIAELFAKDLAQPLQAVETFQVYVQRGNNDEQPRNRIVALAEQLAVQKRYLESLHCYHVFVESFPEDPRIPTALSAIGSLYQANASWKAAIDVYHRIAKEHPKADVLPRVVRSLADCYIHLGDWQAARTVYREELNANPNPPDVAVLKARIDVLDQLQRYQSLLADKADSPTNSDAQFQTGRLVWEKLGNPTRAIVEFQKLAERYPKSALADDARLEMGRALLAVGRTDEARQTLSDLPAKHMGSPLADDALFLLGESYEREAQRLAQLTVDAVREDARTARQREAFQKFTRQPVRVAEVLPVSLPGSMLTNSVADRLFCQVCEAEARAESESVLRVASRQDRINEAYREAVQVYARAARDYPLGDSTDTSLARMARIYESELKDQSKALETYKKIVKLFPGTPLAEDASWKLASFFVAQKKHAEAVEAYREFIRNYPASARVADAQFGVGQVLQRMERWVDAMDAYEIFRQKFGKHPNAPKALEQINWIKTYRRR